MAEIKSKVFLKLFEEPSDKILNGNFESLFVPTVFTSWIPEDIPPVAETVNVHGGDYAAKFITPGSGSISLLAGCYQQIAVIAGRTMKLSFWSMGDGVNPGYYSIMDVTHYVNIKKGNLTLGTSYALTEYEFIVPEGCINIFIMFGAKNNGLTITTSYVDDIVVYDYGGAVWTENKDVMAKPYPTWDYGIQGTGPSDLVAGTGIATFNLDNTGKSKEAAAVAASTVVIDEINGDMENVTGNDFAIWTEHITGTGTITDETSIVHGDTHAMKITNIDSSNYASAEAGMTCVAGKTYTIKIWVKGAYGIAVADGAFGAFDLDDGNEANWTEKTLTITPTVPMMTVFLQLFSLMGGPPVSATGYFDDISISYLVPATPATPALPGLYSPDNDNIVFGFEEGMPVKIDVDYFPTTPENLLSNGDMENVTGNDFAGWTESNIGTGTVTDEQVIVHGGNHSAHFTTALLDEAIMTQAFEGYSGNHYYVTAWVKGDYYIGILSGSVLTGAYDYASGSVADWTQVDLDIVANDNSIEITLYASDGEEGYYDDIIIYAIPTTKTKFVGTVARIEPSASLFDNPIVNLEVHDWIGYASKQELGVQALDTNQTADDALTTVLPEFPKQPVDTDFDIGVETFDLMFNTDDSTESMAKFFQKMARNEQGRIYSEGDGTLVFENRNSRALTTESAFTLDGTMTNFDISYNSAKIYNIISMLVKPTVIDAAATTLLWGVGDDGIAIKAGQTLTLRCKYTDPDTKTGISAVDLVSPVTEFKFGTTQEATSDNMHALLSQTNTVGANSISCALKNTHSTATVYLNQFNIYGKGIYEYDNITMEAIDDDSISQVGEKKYFERLDQITDPSKAYNYAAFIRGNYAGSHIDTCEIKVLANQSDAIAKGLIEAEVSTRFTVTEEVTGVDRDFYINNIQYKQEDTLLWATIEAQASNVDSAFVWDSSHWSSEEDARWQL